MQRDHLGEHTARVVGDLQQAGDVDGLAMADQVRCSDEVVVALLYPGLTAPHPAAEGRVRYPCFLTLAEKLPHSLFAGIACAAPRLDVLSRGHLLAVLNARHLGLCPAVCVGELFTGQARLHAQGVQAGSYQHVTDTMRAEVARQVGSLIWETRGSQSERVTIRRDTLAAILPLVEEAITSGSGGAGRLTGLQEAVADLRSALAGAGNIPPGPAGDTGQLSQ